MPPARQQPQADDERHVANSNSGASVIQEVVHDEPPARRDETVLSLQAQTDWTEQVEQHIQRETGCGDRRLAGENDCLLPDACVLTSRGAVPAISLQEGAVVYGSTSNLMSTMVRCTILPARPRNVTRVSYEGVGIGVKGLKLTSSHVLPVRRVGRAFHPMLWGELQVGDHLRSLSGIMTVRSVHMEVMEIEAIQIELEQDLHTILIGEPGVNNDCCVEVYGEVASAPLGSTLKIFSFVRFDRFREALLESPELEPCRSKLRAIGAHADLSEHALGPGQMFVAATQAWGVIQQLVERGQELRSSDVVVSREYELLVLDLVRHYAPRVLSRKPRVETMQVQMPSRTKVEKTFLEVHLPSTGSTSSVTKSSTDADARTASLNPRTQRGSSML